MKFRLSYLTTFIFSLVTTTVALSSLRTTTTTTSPTTTQAVVVFPETMQNWTVNDLVRSIVNESVQDTWVQLMSSPPLTTTIDVGQCCIRIKNLTWDEEHRSISLLKQFSLHYFSPAVPQASIMYKFTAEISTTHNDRVSFVWDHEIGSSNPMGGHSLHWDLRAVNVNHTLNQIVIFSTEATNYFVWARRSALNPVVSPLTHKWIYANLARIFVYDGNPISVRDFVTTYYPDKCPL